MALVADSIGYEEWILFYYKYVTLFPHTRQSRVHILAGRIPPGRKMNCFVSIIVCFCNVRSLIKRIFLEILLLALYCQIEKRSLLLCIKESSCVSHFKVSSIVWANSKDNVHQPHFLKKKESRSESNRGPPAYQPSALPLGHIDTQTTQSISSLLKT